MTLAAIAISPPVVPAPVPRLIRTLLALDLGSHCGWAALPHSGRIASGVSAFRPDRFSGAGMVYLRFEKFLGDLHRDAGPFDAVVFEEVRAHAGTLAAQVYGGFLAHLTAWCERKGAPYLGVPVATIKRHATGKGNAPKVAVIAAMRAKGFTPRDDNEADALALLDYAISTGIGGRS
jgi:crossover junction endodeoxyribonuclease RuvC